MICNLCPIIHYNSTAGHINRSCCPAVRNYHVVTVYCNIAKCKTSAFNFYQISRCTHSVKRSAARECNIAFDSNCRLAAVIPTSPFIVTVPPDIVTPPTVSPSFHVVSAEIVSVISSAYTKTVLAGNTENIIANASMIDNNFLDFMIFPPKIILFPQKYFLKNLLYLCICSYLNYTPYTDVRCNNF